jgi:hypothetical protein
MDTLRDVGLDLVAKHLAERGVGELSAEAVCTVLGRAGLAGSSRPLPASAALVRLGEAGPLWLPAPSQPAQPDAGRAPLYLHGGRLLVLPTVRLFLRGADKKPEEVAPEYLSLADWFADAVAVWRFARREGAPRSLLEHLREEGVSATEALQAIGRALVYALFGSDGPFTVSGLRLPAAPMWLRPVDETPFALEAARALVVTARLDTDPERPAVPTTDLRAAGYRIRPADRRDWGLDPVHTPEGADIRLTGRLGVGVAVRDRRLHAPDCQRPALSVSTARLPFAGHDDPRRLLMAANMQVHAMPLPLSEAPRVRTDDRGTDPPGVNLRVAYLAWQGSNHEDAWVLSESAARRLGTSEEVVTTAAIGAVELAPEMLVQVGQQVERGQLLLRRFVSPILLSAAVGLLASLPDLDEKVQLRPEVDDTAPESGEVVAIEQWDLGTGEGIPQDWEVPESVRGAFRSVLRIHIRRTLPLGVGDKLANRHGHKGVVGAILPDETMPRWRDEPLDALIDPISVLNRSNWGQIYEALAGAVVPAGESRAFASVSAETVMEEVKRLGADGRGRWSILARDRISGSPVPAGPLGSSVRRRSQRFGEMDHWALWAHGGGAGPAEAAEAKGATLCPAVSRLGRLLAAAGFDLKKEGDTIVLRRLALGEAPPPEWTAFSLTKASEPAGAESKAGGGKGAKTLRSLADLYDALDAITPETPTALVFDPPPHCPGVGPEGGPVAGTGHADGTALAAVAACLRPPEPPAVRRLGGAARADGRPAARGAAAAGKAGRGRCGPLLRRPAAAGGRLCRRGGSWRDGAVQQQTRPAAARRPWPAAPAFGPGNRLAWRPARPGPRRDRSARGAGAHPVRPSFAGQRGGAGGGGQRPAGVAEARPGPASLGAVAGARPGRAGPHDPAAHVAAGAARRRLRWGYGGPLRRLARRPGRPAVVRTAGPGQASDPPGGDVQARKAVPVRAAPAGRERGSARRSSGGS